MDQGPAALPPRQSPDFLERVREARRDFHALRQSPFFRHREGLCFASEAEFELFLSQWRRIEGLFAGISSGENLRGEAKNPAGNSSRAGNAGENSGRAEFSGRENPALLGVVLANLGFVIAHFERVRNWVQSPKFQARYAAHPYPPLLDPDVLNALLEGENSGAAAGNCGRENLNGAQNPSGAASGLAGRENSGADFAAECAAYAREGLTYRTLGAEAAWALNLPLPRRYGFVLFFNPCSSSEALHFFFRLCGLKVGIWGIGGWETYERNYQNALSGKAALATLCPISKLEPYRKHCYLMDGGFSLVLAVRDPISSLKSYCNHIHNVFTAQNITARMREFRAYDEEFIFPEIFYCTEKDPKDRRPSVDALAYLAQDVESFYSLDEILDICADSVREVVVLDFHRDLAFGACFESFRALSQRLGFASPGEGLAFAFEKKVNVYDGLNHLPVRLGFEGFELWVSVPYITHDLRAWRNVTPELFEAEFVLENVFVLIERGAASGFLAHENFEKMRGYVAAYIEALGRYVDGVRARLLGEGDVLEFLASNPAAALKLREAIERNFKRVKAAQPDIVASWKYYAEFERICAGFGVAGI